MNIISNFLAYHKLKRIPVILHFTFDKIESKQILVNNTYTIGKFMNRIRQTFLNDMQSSRALFLIIYDQIHPVNMELKELYKDEPLNIYVHQERVFG